MKNVEYDLEIKIFIIHSFIHSFMHYRVCLAKGPYPPKIAIERFLFQVLVAYLF